MKSCSGFRSRLCASLCLSWLVFAGQNFPSCVLPLRIGKDLPAKKFLNLLLICFLVGPA